MENVFFTIDSFVGPNARGNRHKIQIVSLVELRNLQAECFSSSCIYVYLAELNSKVFEVRFFKNGNEIYFCGSGIVASARCLFESLRSFNSDVFLKGLFGSVVLRCKKNVCNEHSINNEESLLFGYEFPTKKYVNSYKPRSALNFQRILYKKIKNVQYVGFRSGYCVVELGSGIDAHEFKKIHLSVRRFQRFCHHALILTAQSPDSSSSDYWLRYFAPQWGNKEDAATGSANSVLVPYWHNRLGKKTLRGRQLSERGGVFLSYAKFQKSLVYGLTYKVL